MKRTVSILLAVLVLCLCSACGGGAGSSSVESISSAIAEDGKIIPGGGLQWNMSEQDFQKSELFTKELDRSSDSFQEDRVGTTEYSSGMHITFYEPLATVHVGNLDLDLNTEYGFDDSGSLTYSGYRCLLRDSTPEEFAAKLEQIRTDINTLGFEAVTDNTESALTEDVVSGNSSYLQWSTPDGGYVELTYMDLDAAHRTIGIRVSLFNTREI